MKKLLILLILLFFFSCKTDKKEDSIYPRSIGDISFDAQKDDIKFKLCNEENEAHQYFDMGNGLSYKGEKIALENVFSEQYKPVVSNQSGLIRIRFMVNCEGKTGRYRVIEMNKEYKEIKFDAKITSQLLKITKTLNGWKGYKKEDRSLDYYQYLIFKIEKGTLIEILP